MKTLLLAATLLAHSWYPPECCHELDCHEVPCNQVMDGKWQGRPFGSKRVSPDGKCHACMFGEKLYCVFVPAES